MSVQNLSRREMTIGVVLLIVVAFGFALFLGLTTRRAAWTKAVKTYRTTRAQVAKEKALIAKRAYWEEQVEKSSQSIPEVDPDEVVTKWKRTLSDLAKSCNIVVRNIADLVAPNKSKDEQEENVDKNEVKRGDVWEMSFKVDYQASLERLVDFIYALESSNEGLFDVSELHINNRKNDGVLNGTMTIACAYKKGLKK